MNLQRLDELAAEATDGPREHDRNGVHQGRDPIALCYGDNARANAAFIAAADPEIVRALIDVAEAVERLRHPLTRGEGIAATNSARVAKARLDAVLRERGDR